jgi:hypothetical protein
MDKFFIMNIHDATPKISKKNLMFFPHFFLLEYERKKSILIFLFFFGHLIFKF